MQYAVELYFDKETERRLWEIPDAIREAGLSTKYHEWKTRPHITLACFSDVDEEEALIRLRAFAEEQTVMPAYLASLAMFTDTKVIYAAPIMREEMYVLQKALYEAMAGFDTKGWEWYLPGRWVPHCGLALMGDDPEENFYKACDLALRKFQKTVGKFTSVGLVKISCPVVELETFVLKDR